MGIKQEWIKLHFGAIKDYFRKLGRKYIIIFIPLFLILSLFVFLSLPIIIETRMESIPPDLLNSPELAYLYLKLVVFYTLMQAHFHLFNVVYVMIWWVICYLLFLIMRLAVDIVYQIFYPSDNKFEKRYKKYKKEFHKILNKRFSIIFLIIVVGAFFIIIDFEPWNKKSNIAIAFFIKIIFIIILIVYIFYWINVLLIRKKRRSKLIIDEYLFSPYSIRRRFKNVLDALVFMSILIWIFMHSMLSGFEYTSNKKALIMNRIFEYNVSWVIINNEYKLESVPEDEETWSPPSPDKLPEVFNPLYSFTEKDSLIKVLKILKLNLFIAVVLIGLFEMGPTVLIKTYNERGFRNSIIMVVVNTIRSTIFIGLIYIIAKTAFSIDLSSSILGILFSFIMTFFFAFESIAKR